MNILHLARQQFHARGVRKIGHTLKRYLEFYDQEGFFDASLYKANLVSDCTVENFAHKMHLKKPDALVCNWKFQAKVESWGQHVRLLKDIAKDVHIAKALVIGVAEAELLPGDDVLDDFDIIFKREPFKDRDRYAISEENKAKIVPTMIHCPFVHAPRDNWLSRAYHLVRPQVEPCRPGEAVYDVGFSGADASEHSLRRDVWQRVVGEDFSRIGGLQPNPYTKAPLPEALRGPRYKGRAYRNALCAAKINLALDGMGQYTFRHQELLYLGCFMMSGPSIRELELPMPLEENKHYVAFDDLDDMVEKIRYYLTHEEERLKIAAAGKKLFDEYYDAERHGQQILAALQQVQLK